MGASEKEIASPASVSIGAKIAAAQSRQIKSLIEAGVFLNESDFVRDAIRQRLAEIKSSNAGMLTMRPPRRR
jgi:Arc/MetJ-type ribon-helix-helix transcriptional regulator